METRRRIILGTLVLSLATFMSVLDISIVNVALPAMAGDLGASPTQGTSIITSFSVAMAVAMPLAGWLAKRVGSVRLFAISVAAFSLLSVACGMARSMEAVVALRVLQGAAAGTMIPLAQALLLRLHPPSRHGSALAIFSLTTFVAPLAGPVVAGWITDNWSWRWIFYMNLPVGIFCGLAAARIFVPLETPVEKARLDAPGIFLLIAAVGSFQVMLDLGRTRDWFASGEIVILGVASAVSLAAFLLWESGRRDPVIDLTLFHIPSFGMGTFVSSLAYGLYIGNMVLIPLWLVQYMGCTALVAGVVLAPIGIVGILLVPLGGRWVDRHDARWVATTSFLVLAVSLWMRSHYSTTADLEALMLPSYVQGVASAFFFAPLLAIILSQVPPQRFAAASGLSNCLRFTTGAIGISLLTTAWEWRASFHRSRLGEALVEGSLPLQRAQSDLGASPWSPTQQWVVIERMLDQQAHTLALNEIFQLSAVMFVGLVFFVWLTDRRPKAGTQTRAVGLEAG